MAEAKKKSGKKAHVSKSVKHKKVTKKDKKKLAKADKKKDRSVASEKKKSKSKKKKKSVKA
jgi:hypothetical protein